MPRLPRGLRPDAAPGRALFQMGDVQPPVRGFRPVSEARASPEGYIGAPLAIAPRALSPPSFPVLEARASLDRELGAPLVAASFGT